MSEWNCDCVLDDQLWLCSYGATGGVRIDPATGAPQTGRSEEGAPDHLGRLQGIGITHVLNCTEGAKKGFVNAFPDSFEYLDLELDDRSPDPSAEMKAAVEFAQGALGAGGKVLLHCERGVNRSGTMAIACVMVIGDMPLQEAYEQVLARRPMVAQGGGPRIEFVEALIRLEQSTRGCCSLDIELVKARKVMALKEGTTLEEAVAALSGAGGDVDAAAVALWSG